MLRLLFDTQVIALLIKLCYTISLRITYTIAKYSSFVILLCIYYCLMQHLVQTSTIEDIVTKYKASRIITYKLLADYECLCQTIRRSLLCILLRFALHGSPFRCAFFNYYSTDLILRNVWIGIYQTTSFVAFLKITHLIYTTYIFQRINFC